MIAPSVTDVVFTSADPAAQRTGLLGYIRCSFGNALILDGIALRRTAAGKRVLSFPSRTDGQGRKHPLYRPVDDATRRQLEAAVFAALGLDPEGGHDGH
ncbi:MAG: hypothetical protein U1F36_17075 [Planctomycetota bacterium]